MHGLNEGKLRMQEDRLAQYGLLSKNGSYATIPASRHANIPISTDSQSRIELGNVQVNAANLGERRANLNNVTISAGNDNYSSQPSQPAGISRNPYSDNLLAPPS